MMIEDDNQLPEEYMVHESGTVVSDAYFDSDEVQESVLYLDSLSRFYQSIGFEYEKADESAMFDQRAQLLMEQSGFGTQGVFKA